MVFGALERPLTLFVDLKTASLHVDGFRRDASALALAIALAIGLGLQASGDHQPLGAKP